MRTARIVAAAGAMLLGSAGIALADPPTPATGTFTQTTVVSQEVSFAGPNLVLEASVAGTVTGTLSGTFEESHTVVIHPNGRFTAQGNGSCTCTVGGQTGVVDYRVTDTGEEIDGIPTFEGRYMLLGGTGELSGLRGVLQMQGALDPASGLFTIDYSGEVHSHP